ncbi:MAG TPA: DUF1127 domain-containing protein [Pseudolabrys sp.]|nr:DUF1127 domain-containing protein [Pseudolabrys sp.]
MSCGGGACVSNNPNDLIAGDNAPARRSRLLRFLAKLGAMFVEAGRRQVAIDFEKVRQRRLLLQLDDRLLKDTGLTREQAEREGRKAFWE